MPIFNARWHLTISAAAIAVGLTTPALAQSADPAAGVDVALPNDIVVTAQRRETRLQETPAAITAIGGATLQNAAIVGANDLVKAAPGLVVTDGGAGQRRISLRGIRSVGEAQVGIYYDEAPVAAPPGTTSDAGGSPSGPAP